MTPYIWGVRAATLAQLKWLLIPLFSLTALLGQVPQAVPDQNANIAKPDQAIASKDDESFPAARALEPTVVNVTAQRTAEETGTTPEEVNVVSSEMLERRQPATPNGLLREEPGIFSVQVAAQGSPIIRGQIGNRVLYLWNGLRINNGALFAGPNGYFNEFPMGAIERMEVVRGPGAVEYGSDAVGGVVNIIGKQQDFSSDKHWGGDIYGRYGSVNDEKTTYGDLWGSFSRFSVDAGITGQNLGNYSAPEFGTIPNTGLATEGGYFNTAWRVREKQTLRLSWIENRRDGVVAYAQSKLNPSLIPRSNTPYEERGIGLFSYEIFDAGPWSHELRFYTYFEHFRSPRDVTVETASAFNITRTASRQNVPGGGVQSTTSIKKSSLVYGADYRSEDIFSAKKLYMELKSDDVTTVSIPNGNVPPGSYDVFDGFALNRWNPVRRLTVSAGGRVESIRLKSNPRPQDALTPFTVQDLTLDKRWNPLTGSVGAVYALTNNLTLAGNIASGFRAPTFSDALSTGVPVYASGIATVPSPKVEPEKSITYEFGPRWASRRFSLHATAYWTALRNIIETQNSGTIDIPGIGTVIAQSNINSGNGFVRGVETAFAYRINSQWTLLGNFTATRGDDTFEHNRLRFIPPANGLTALAWDSKSRRFWSEMNTVLVDRLRHHAPADQLDSGFSLDPGFGSPSATNPPYRPGYQIPGYAVANLRVGAHLWREGRRGLDVTLDLNNVLNQCYREPYSQQQLRAPGFGAVIGSRWRF